MQTLISGSLLPGLEVALQPGEMVIAPPGEMSWMTPNTQMNTTTAALTTISGIKNAPAGGDGVFLVQLTGPGRVWLQTMTVPTLAHALAPFIGRNETTTVTTDPGTAALGAVFCGIFGSDR